jgi:molybdate transport system substrate-binding protein
MIRSSRAALIALVLAPCAIVASAQKPELHIAAASDLTPVIPALAAAYEHEKGVRLIASFGSSATLAQQLESGDPQDVFLSADYLHPEELVAANLAVEKSPVTYARGVLVLWARRDSPAQPISLDSLTKPSVQKIAIANQLHAPYGLAAVAAIKNLNLTDKIAPKLVVAENIAQTAQFAESGNAQIAFISLTIASSPHFNELGTFVRLPNDYPPIQQCGVVLKSSKNQAAALDFLNWLTSAPVQAKLKTMGLDPAN